MVSLALENMAIKCLFECSERIETHRDMHNTTVSVSCWNELGTTGQSIELALHKKRIISQEHEKFRKTTLPKYAKKPPFKINKADQQKLSRKQPGEFLNQQALFPPIKNNVSRNMNVLSYPFPSWRFIVSLNTYEYVVRSHPKDISNCYDISPTNSFHRLDPAKFYDEQLTDMYKALQCYKPDEKNAEVIKKLKNISLEINDMPNKLHLKTILKIPSASFDQESYEHCEKKDSCIWKIEKTKQLTQSKDKGKSKKLTHKRKKKIKGTQTKFYYQSNKNLTKSLFPLQSIEETESSKANNTTMQEFQNKFPKLNCEKYLKEALSQYPTSFLAAACNYSYLPTLNYQNYSNFCKSEQKHICESTVKLPPVFGMKVDIQ